VVFRDDVFGTKKAWLNEFSEKYTKEIGLPYFCYTHPGTVDSEIASLLKSSGCVFTTMGVQSADDTVRREILNRKYTNEQVIESVSVLKKNGIRVSLDQIVGLPGETKKQLIDAAELYVNLRPDRLLTFWLECFPGTGIMRIARERGLLSAEDEDAIRRGHAGYRYSGGTLGAGSSLAGIVNFLNAIPLIPRNIAASMIKKGYAERFPSSSLLQIFLMVANAIFIRDPFFFYNIRFMFSKKRIFSQGGTNAALEK